MASSQASGVNTPPYVDFKRAVELMLDGHPVIFPTETFFALGSRALDADATARVYRAKHRSTVRPLPLILGDWEQLDMIAKVHDELMPLLKRFWPGPLSVPGTPPRPGHPHRGHGTRGRAPVLSPRSPRACAGRRRTHHLQQREHQRQSRRRQRQSARRRADRFGHGHP